MRRGAGYDRRVTRRLPILVACACALALPGAAAAHAGLVGTSPADGARLTAPPPAVVARYSEPLADVTEAVVTVDGTAVSGPGRARLATDDATRARIPLPASLRGGRVTVRWTVRSADAHLLEDGIVFTVARPTLRADLRSIAAALDAAAGALRAIPAA